MGKKKNSKVPEETASAVVPQQVMVPQTLPITTQMISVPPTEPSEYNIDLGEEHQHVARAEVLNGFATPVYATMPPQPFPQQIIIPQAGGTLKSTAVSEQVLSRPAIPIQQPPQAHSVVGVPTGNILIGRHIPLAKCRVLYLGSAVPLETTNGIESVQQPLRER